MLEEDKDLRNKIEPNHYKLRTDSWFFVFIFYGALTVALLIGLFLLHINIDIFWASLVIVGGNFLLVTISQISNWFVEVKSFKKEPEKWLFQDFSDCLIRCSSGLMEMILYTFLLTGNRKEGGIALIAGYLLMKSIAAWKPSVDDDEKEKGLIDRFREYSARKRGGLHTAILRISIVLSILFAFWAASFLK